MSYSEKLLIADRLGFEAEVGVFGELKTAGFTPQIPIAFDRPINPAQLKSTGTPVSQYHGSLLQLQQGDAVESVESLRYLEGETSEIYFTAQFNGTYSAGTDRTTIGLYDTDDGVYLGFIGSDFVVAYRSIYADGVGSEPDTVQVIPTPANIDRVHRYRIRYGYLGVGNIAFERKLPGDWETLHVFETDGSLAGRTHIGRTAIPLRAECGHAGAELLSGSWVAGTYGTASSVQESPYFSNGERTVAGDPAGLPLVAFRSKTTNGTRPNYVTSQLLESEFSTGSEGLYAIEIFKFPAGSLVTGAWSDVSAGSVLEVNTTFTETSAAGTKLLGTFLPVPSAGFGVSRSTTDYRTLGIRAHPGEEFGIYKRELISGVGNDLTAWSIAYSDLY